MTKKCPRLLVVGAFPPPNSNIFGGIVTSCQTLLRSSFPERFELGLIDSTQISNPPPRFLLRLKFATRRVFLFLTLLYRFRPHCVLLFTAVGASLLEKGAMAWIARVFGIPALMFPRGGQVIDQSHESVLNRLWIRLAFAGASKVLCQGPAWQRFAVDSLGFSETDAPIIFNWTATERLLAIGRRRATSPNQPVRLLFLGWLERAKGIFELIEACSRLAPSHAFSLTIAGKGHAEAEAENRVAMCGLSDRVQFLGWLQGADLERVLQESDVLVLPSWVEGLPNAMIEAMASGLAVVVSSVGNVPDVVNDGEEALLVPPQDSDALQRALARVISDAEFRVALAGRGHRFCRDNFAVEPAVEKLDEVVQAAIRRASGNHETRYEGKI